MFWFSLGAFIGQNEELLLLSHLAKTYRFRDLKIEFQSSVYIFSGCWYNLPKDWSRLDLSNVIAHAIMDCSMYYTGLLNTSQVFITVFHGFIALLKDLPLNRDYREKNREQYRNPKKPIGHKLPVFIKNILYNLLYLQ